MWVPYIFNYDFSRWCSILLEPSQKGQGVNVLRHDFTLCLWLLRIFPPLPSFDPLYMSIKKGYQSSRYIVFNLIVQRAGMGERWLKQMTLAYTTFADEVSQLSRISWPSEQIETITILEQCLGFQWYHTEHVSDGFNCFASTLFGIKTGILTKFSFSCFDPNHLVIRDVKSSSSMQIVTLNHQDCNLNSRSEWICLVYVQGLFASEIQQHICVISVWIALVPTLVPY